MKKAESFKNVFSLIDLNKKKHKIKNLNSVKKEIPLSFCTLHAILFFIVLLLKCTKKHYLE